MKPRLFRSDATKFDTLGFGALNSTISCIVKEELGVAPTLEMSILMDDPNFVNIEVGNIITALPNKRDQIQAFVIEDITKPINGVVTIYATHIAQHRGKLIPVQPFTASDLDDAFYEIKTNSLEANPFTLVRDPGKANVTATMHPTAPHSFRELLGGVEGSILDTYRGEWGYDNFTITLYNKRGHDNGARVMYGRNMSDFHLEEQFNWNDSVTGVFGYWLGENGDITLSNIQYSQYADLYPYHKTVCVDFSDKFEAQPSTLDLDTYALSWINGKGLVGASVDVAYEHVNVEGGADVGIGDIVHIYNGVYDFEMESRIVGLEFDVLSEEYTNVSIGDMKTTLNEAISDINGGSVGSGGASVEPTTTTPLMDGTAAIGTEQKYARGDHVHPTDTSRAGFNDLTINNISWSDKWLIPDNTDFNSLKTIGVYYVYNNDSMQTMSNRPVDSAGMLTVVDSMRNTPTGTTLSGNWQYATQEFKTFTGELYVRYINTNGSGVWTYGTWAKYLTNGKTKTAEAVDISQTSNWTTTTLFTSGGTERISKTITKAEGYTKLKVSFFVPLKTSNYTARAMVYVDGSQMFYGGTNDKTDESIVAAVGFISGLAAGSHTVALRVGVQTSGVTATMLAYRGGYMTIEEI